jgi:CRISPR/Cas system CMR subunit Cmr4 (Cas7 group RAMP superfamily)
LKKIISPTKQKKKKKMNQNNIVEKNLNVKNDEKNLNVKSDEKNLNVKSDEKNLNNDEKNLNVKNDGEEKKKLFNVLTDGNNDNKVERKFKTKRKAIVLFSGGLDSLICSKYMEIEQNIPVCKVSFSSPFWKTPAG